MSSKLALMTKLATFLGLEEVPEPTTLDEQFHLGFWEVMEDGSETGTYISVALDGPITMSFDGNLFVLSETLVDRNLGLAVVAAANSRRVVLANG